MDIEKCKKCKHHSSYFHGSNVNDIKFSHRCWWTIKGPEKVAENECHYEKKERGE